MVQKLKIIALAVVVTVFANLTGKVEEYSAGKVDRCWLVFCRGSICDHQFVVISQLVSNIDVNLTRKSVFSVQAS